MKIRDDFILRIIEVIGDILSSVLSGKKCGSINVESISIEKIGLSFNTLLSMEAAPLYGLLGANPDHHAIKTYLAAALFLYEAQSQDELGKGKDAELFYKKAGILLDKLEQIEGLPFAENIKKLQNMIIYRLSGGDKNQ